MSKLTPRDGERRSPAAAAAGTLATLAAAVAATGASSALAEPPGPAEPALSRAMAFFQAGDSASGVAACEEATADPAAPFLHSEPGLVCLAQLGAARFVLADYEAAAALWSAWLVHADGLLPPESPDRTVLLGNLGRAHLERGAFADALPLFQEAHARQVAAVPKNDPSAVGYLPFLARTLSGLGRLDEARAALEQRLAQQERALGGGSGEARVAMGDLAELIQDQGDYARAEDLLRRAARLGEQASSPGAAGGSVRGDRVLADTLNRLGELLRERGRYADALETFHRMESVQEALLGAGHVEIASGLLNQGNVLTALGRDVEARAAYERALSDFERGYGPDHPFVATALTCLGVLLQRLGDSAGALPLLERAVRVDEAALGPDHEWVGTALNNLAMLRWQRGEAEPALRLYERSRAILEKRLGLDHPQSLSVRGNIATLLRDGGRLEEARAILEEDVGRSERRLGAAHPETALLRASLGEVLWWLGDFRASRDAYAGALAVEERALGPDHPTVSAHRYQLAAIDFALGEREKARAAMAATFSAVDRRLEPLLGITSERERLALVRSERENLDLYLSIFHEPEDASAAWDAVLRWKGLVSASLVEQREALLSSGDAALAEALAELAATRRQLAETVFDDALPEAERATRMQGLTAQKEALERDLARRSALFRGQQARRRASGADLCRALGADEALADVLRYHRVLLDERGIPVGGADSYVAFVAAGGACDGGPVRVELGEAAPVDEKVATWRKLMQPKTQATALQKRGAELRALLLDPLEGALAGRKTVWVVADGSLSGLPLAALPAADGRPLLETRVLGCLASAGELLRETGPAGEGALIFGGISYDGMELPENEEESEMAQGIAEAESATRSAPRGELGSFSFLPNTQKEAGSVAEELGRLTGAVQTLSGAAADEGRFRRLAPGHRFIHLATHGFFASGALPSALRDGAGWNPMLLSGIVLAGANRPRDGGDDGILTAEEVVGLDLRSVELVTLSACETGLGEVADGEGVLGLRRAFALAGARALVFSLWKVPDAETALLMRAFYARLAAEANPAAALRAAQLDVVAKLRAEGREAHPFFWAAFVVSGR
jgi:CHAT domain-containing protein